MRYASGHTLQWKIWSSATRWARARRQDPRATRWVFTYRNRQWSFKTTSNLLSFTGRPPIINVFWLLKKNEHGECFKCHQVWSMKFIYIMFKKFQIASEARVLSLLPKVILFQSLISAHSHYHLPCHVHLISLTKKSKALKPYLSLNFNKISLNFTSYQTPANYDYVMVYVS